MCFLPFYTEWVGFDEGTDDALKSAIPQMATWGMAPKGSQSP